MANHCIDVVCAGCGRCWCLRGCDGSEPNPKIAERARRRHAIKPGFVWDEHCCEGFPVLSRSIIYGDKDPEPPPEPKSLWDRIGEGE